MADFVQKYLHPRRSQPLVILDLGSQDFNGSYRSLFENPPWRYVGLDMAPGKNVDVVLRDPYHWREIKAESADVIVSGQTFEHTEFFWLSMREIARALKVGGLLCLIAPSARRRTSLPGRLLASLSRRLARVGASCGIGNGRSLDAMGRPSAI